MSTVHVLGPEESANGGYIAAVVILSILCLVLGLVVILLARSNSRTFSILDTQMRKRHEEDSEDEDIEWADGGFASREIVVVERVLALYRSSFGSQFVR